MISPSSLFRTLRQQLYVFSLVKSISGFSLACIEILLLFCVPSTKFVPAINRKNSTRVVIECVTSRFQISEQQPCFSLSKTIQKQVGLEQTRATATLPGGRREGARRPSASHHFQSNEDKCIIKKQAKQARLLEPRVSSKKPFKGPRPRQGSCCMEH